MKGLRFFTRTSAPGFWNIASYHSPHSLTWRWVLTFSPFKGDEARAWPLWCPYRTSDGALQWSFRIPWIGLVSFHQQRPMWFRDLYHRMRDEQVGLSRPKPEASTAGLVAIDGGKSVH